MLSRSGKLFCAIFQMASFGLRHQLCLPLCNLSCISSTTQIVHTDTRRHTHKHTHICMHPRTLTHTHTHTYTPTQIHAYTQTIEWTSSSLASMLGHTPNVMTPPNISSSFLRTAGPTVAGSGPLPWHAVPQWSGVSAATDPFY